jgi:preprotein translocase subunit SecD
LPGIAGIVLTVGMAVGANVLIFERIKEEIGLNSNIQEAILSGYDKAILNIADGNITTLIHIDNSLVFLPP